MPKLFGALLGEATGEVRTYDGTAIAHDATDEEGEDVAQAVDKHPRQACQETEEATQEVVGQSLSHRCIFNR